MERPFRRARLSSAPPGAGELGRGPASEREGVCSRRRRWENEYPEFGEPRHAKAHLRERVLCLLRPAAVGRAVAGRIAEPGAARRGARTEKGPQGTLRHPLAPALERARFSRTTSVYSRAVGALRVGTDLKAPCAIERIE